MWATTTNLRTYEYTVGRKDFWGFRGVSDSSQGFREAEAFGIHSNN